MGGCRHDSSGDGPPRIWREAAEQIEQDGVVDDGKNFAISRRNTQRWRLVRIGCSAQAAVRAETRAAREGLRRGPAIDPGRVAATSRCCTTRSRKGSAEMSRGFGSRIQNPRGCAGYQMPASSSRASANAHRSASSMKAATSALRRLPRAARCPATRISGVSGQGTRRGSSVQRRLGGRPQASLLGVSQQAVVGPPLELPLEFFPHLQAAVSRAENTNVLSHSRGRGRARAGMHAPPARPGHEGVYRSLPVVSASGFLAGEAGLVQGESPPDAQGAGPGPAADLALPILREPGRVLHRELPLELVEPIPRGSRP